MQDGVPPPDSADLRSRLVTLGRSIGAREAVFHEALAEATRRCEALRSTVCDALAGFHAAVSEAGAPHLRIEVGPVRLDDKHIRAIEFEMRRGRNVGIVIVKSRGDVTLVGPFQSGKVEGPCRTFPWDAENDIQKALGDFLEKFLEEAAAP